MKEIIQSDSVPAFVMELLTSGTLASNIPKEGEAEAHQSAVSIMRQLISALDYLHKQDIVHLGVRLENMMISSQYPIHIKLTGFRFSTCDWEFIDPLPSVCMAPKLWERAYRSGVSPGIWENLLASRGYSEPRSRPFYGSPIDMWDAGVVCSLLTLGKAPCYHDSESSADEKAASLIDLLLASKIQNPKKKSQALAQMLGFSTSSVPPLLLSFLQKLLDPEPTLRAKAGDCLVDAWLVEDSQGNTDNAVEHDLEKPTRKRRRLNK